MIEGKRRLRKSKSIKLKIEKGTNWLGVGIAYNDTLSKTKYQFTVNLGHGAYLISYQGYLFHSDDEKIN